MIDKYRGGLSPGSTYSGHKILTWHSGIKQIALGIAAASFCGQIVGAGLVPA